MVDPEPDMNTAVTFPSFSPAALSLFFSSSSSGSSENAGASRSLTQTSSAHPRFLIASINASGSSVLKPPRSSALKICGVDKPTLGFTSSMGVVSGRGGSTSSTISPLPVQYAAPVEKNTEISEPMSPLHSRSCSSVAGAPHNTFAAHMAVAAFPEPPPRPAP